ncbi:MAG: ZIP family metal transporter [Candidatus Limnocylindrales bacterium]
MLEAGGWGLFAASSLVLGAILSFTGWIRARPLRLVTAFGAGVLISAVAYDLVEEAVLKSAAGVSVAAGFVLGSLVFYGGSALVERWTSGRSQGTGILFGAALDGIPESVVLGVSLLAGGGVSLAVLVAVFISNVPEGLASSTGLTTAGHGRGQIMGVWIVVAGVSGVVAAISYAALGQAGPDVIGFIEAFAAGAILTMLADDMIPDAYVEGDKLPGVATAAGFAVAALLSFST